MFLFRFSKAGDNEARAGLQAAGGVYLHIVHTVQLLLRSAESFLKYMEYVNSTFFDFFTAIAAL